MQLQQQMRGKSQFPHIPPSCPHHATLVCLPGAERAMKSPVSFLPWTPQSQETRGEEHLKRDVLLAHCLTLHQEQ